MKILWVEDQIKDNRHLIQVAEEEGAYVFPCTSVSEAIAKLREEDFDTVVLDLRIPLGHSDEVSTLEDTDYNGQHVLAFIEETGLLKCVRILCLTNYHDRAKSVLRGRSVRIVKKGCYLHEFKRILNEK